MRILIFTIWIALGIIYFFIWSMRKNCCDLSKANQGQPSAVLETQNQAAPLQPQIPAETKSIARITKSDSVSDLKSLPIIGVSCIKFKWADSEPITDPCFIAWKDTVISSLQAGQVLEIIGGFYEKENKIMASGDLGLLRASSIKKLIGSAIPATNIKIRSKNLGDTINTDFATTTFITYKGVFQNDQVKELDEKTMIYFKFASNAGVNDILINQYVSYLAKKIKNTQDQILITGHTDDDATAETNFQLGLRRANIIKNLLVARGISSTRIKTDSKGEEMPIAPNDTEENRKLNRRVEVVILSPAHQQ